jgi:hypothetical protein
MRRFLDYADYAARIAFFAIAPFCVFILAAIFPVAATLVNLALCLAVVGFADLARGAQVRVPLLSTVLTGPLEFERYYRLHPPKPFAYYIFYPVLFPYWLAVDSARREFFMYKTINIISLVLLAGTAVYEYFAYFKPELGLAECVLVLAVSGVLEIVVVMLMLMPLATSLVKYRLAGKRSRLVVLVLVGAASVAVAIFGIERRRDPVVSWAAHERLTLRTKVNKPKGRASQVAAVKAAWAVIPKHREEEDVDSDGKVIGEAMDHARAALAKFYKSDEAQAFDAWVSHRTKTRAEVLVLYVAGRGKRLPMFVALDRAGHEVRDLKQLPKGALAAMKVAADGIVFDF